MAQTKTTDLFIPQVVGQKIATDYGRFITVSKFATVDTTLVARPGDTITRNQFQYIGDASVLAEGAPDTPAKLQSSPITKKVVKVSKQVEITDEAILAGADNPYGEAVEQIGMAIAIKDDKDAITEIMTTTQTATGTSLAKAIVAGMKVFGERGMKIPAIAFVNSADYYDMVSDNANWIPASEIAAELVQLGVVGKYMGANIVPTDTVTANAPVMMLRGALTKEMKRNFLAERDRILNNGDTSYAWLLAGSEHRVYWLNNVSNAVKLTVGNLTEVSVSPYTLTDDLWGVALTDIQGDDIEQSGRDILGTLKYLSGDNAITQVWGEGNFIAVTFTPSANAVKTEVGIKNLVELDPDNSALIKVEDQYGSKLRVVQTDSQGRKFESYFNLDKLTLEEGE